MNWLQTVVSAAAREIREVLSHPLEVFACIVMPVVWCILIAGLLNDGLMRNLPIGVTDYDRSAESQNFIQAVDALPSVRLESLSKEEAEEKTRSGRLMGYLVIPENWSESRSRSEGQSLELHLSRTVYAISTVIELDVKKALIDWASQNSVKKAAQIGGTDNAERLVKAISTYEVIVGNQAFNFRAYLAAALIPMLLGLAGLLALTNALVREWRDRDVRKLLADKAAPSAVIAGKSLPWFLLYSLLMTAYVVWFAGFEGHAPAGSIGLWILAGIVYILGLSGFALLFSAVAPTWVFAVIMGVITTAPTIPFTGFSYPYEDLSAGAQLFADFLPLTWFLKLQACEWVLDSPLSHYFTLLFKAALFFAIPAAIAFPVLSKRMKGWAEAELHPDTHAGDEQPAPRSYSGFLGRLLAKILCDHNVIAVFVGGVAFYLILYGWPYMNEQMTSLPTVIVDLDGSAASRELVRQLNASSKIDIKAVAGSEAEGLELLKVQTADVAVLIPRNYEKDTKVGTPVKIGVYGNGAFPAKIRNVSASVMTLIQAENQKNAMRLMLMRGASLASVSRSALAPPSLVTENLYNKIGGYRGYLLPMAGVLIIQSVMLMGITLWCGEWLRTGCWPRVFEMGMRTGRYWTGMAFVFTAIMFFWLIYAEGGFFSYLGFSTMQNFWGTVLLSLLYAAAAAAFGLAIVMLLGGNSVTAPVVVLSSAPFVFLSGGIYPGVNFAWWAEAFSRISPSTPAINAMLALSQNGAEFRSVLPELLNLLILFAVYSTVAWTVSRKRLREYDAVSASESILKEKQ